METTERPLYDVAIIGGGLVGASLARALAPLGWKLALIEAQAAPVTAAAWDERCIALNAASQRIIEGLGLWPALAPSAEPITSTHISERGRFGVARFTAAEAGLPALGYNAPLRAIGATFAGPLAEQPGLDTWVPARLVGLQPGERDVRLRVVHDGREQALSARLVVAADGARSAVRDFLGIDAAHRDYEQVAIVSAVRPQRAHAGVAYERFLPTGPIAVLPKPDDAGGHACSLVWTVPAARQAEFMGLDDAAFLAAAHEAFGERLGAFRALGRRQAYPLERVLSERLSAPRVLLAGNAAQALHPVAAQGFNLGLRDVATLADTLTAAVAAGGAVDPGAPALLADYSARRERDRARVAGFTDGIVRLFSNAIPGLRGLRHLGLLALELHPGLREAVLQQNLGYGTPAPRLARGR